MANVGPTYFTAAPFSQNKSEKAISGRNEPNYMKISILGRYKLAFLLQKMLRSTLCISMRYNCYKKPITDLYDKIFLCEKRNVPLQHNNYFFIKIYL